MALGREHSEFSEMYDNRFSTNIETKSLSEELDLADSCSLNMNFKCNVCDKNFYNLNCLNVHKEEHKDEQMSVWKSREDKMTKEVCKLKLEVSSELLTLREQEIADSIRCKCKGYCHIYHHKHNWTAYI